MKITTSSTKRRHRAKPGIFLLAVALLVGMVGYGGTCGGGYNPPPSDNLEIRTWYDLDAVRDNLAGTHKLMNNLDSTTLGYTELASPAANEGRGWDPIGPIIIGQGDYARYYGIQGTFDGQGYEICDLVINRTDESNVGLFGHVEGHGVIRNIGVINVTVTANVEVGGLVGSSAGTVSNSYSSGNVSGEDGVGILVGSHNGIVSDSYSTGIITGHVSTGGLVGYSSGTVSNSYSSANVSGEQAAGILVGTNNGIVSDSYSSGRITGHVDVGGLAGASYNTVNNCYSTGIVIGDLRVGGLVGSNDYATVNSCHSSAIVTGGDYVGGLVGKNSNYGTVNNSFWDIETSGQATSDGGTGKTTAEMQDIATFSGAAWNIAAVALNETNPAYIWNIVNNLTYPFLGWQS
jgi:hypothetical protein